MNIVAIDTDANWELPVKKENGSIVEVCESVKDHEFDFSDVPVFKCRLRYGGHERKNTHAVRHLFRDEQTGMVYRFSPKTMEALMQAILNGEVDIDTESAAIEGLFTFALFSTSVFATPLSRADRARLLL